METAEGNKLIAEFMGSRFYDPPITDSEAFYDIPAMKGIYALSRTHFSTSWDWLMPVVEKIENVYTKEYESGFIVRIEYKDIFVMTLDTSEELIICDQSESKLEGVYWTCVKFIKWYNKNK